MINALSQYLYGRAPDAAQQRMRQPVAGGMPEGMFGGFMGGNGSLAMSDQAQGQIPPQVLQMLMARMGGAAPGSPGGGMGWGGADDRGGDLGRGEGMGRPYQGEGAAFGMGGGMGGMVPGPAMMRRGR
jgi:hypothetical protein